MALSTPLRFVCFLVVLFALAARVQSHNWVNMPGRAAKVSSTTAILLLPHNCNSDPRSDLASVAHHCHLFDANLSVSR